MATAIKESPAAGQLARHARAVRGAGSMELVTFEDNGGAHRWRIIDGDGATLARSGGFGSRQDAEQAARRVRDGAASARFGRRAGEGRPDDLDIRGDRPAEDLDAERWLNEGGSFSSEAVPRWPAQR